MVYIILKYLSHSIFLFFHVKVTIYSLLRFLAFSNAYFICICKCFLREDFEVMYFTQTFSENIIMFATVIALILFAYKSINKKTPEFLLKISDYRSLQVKLQYNMSSRVKMEKFMESGLSRIFQVKVVSRNIVLGFHWTRVEIDG